MKATRISLIAVLAAATVLAYSPAFAQEAKDGKDAPKKERPPGGGKGGDMMKERLDKIAEELKLTDDQKKKVEAAFKEQGEKRQALRDATPEERQEKGKALREEMNKKMKAILTAEQYTKWEAMPRGPGGPDGKGGGKKKKGGEGDNK